MKIIKPITFILLSLGLSVHSSALDLTEEVQTYMVDKYDLDLRSVEIEMLNNPFSNIDKKDLKIKFRPLTESKPKGLFTVLTELTRDELLVKRSQLRLRVRHFQDVLVSQKRLTRHETLKSDYVKLTRMDITSLREQPFFSLDDVFGFRMKRNLGQGKILTDRAIEVVPDIEVGQEVTIFFEDGMFVISTSGRSMQSGSAGDLIKVKNKQSGKIVVAQVVDKQSVSVGPIKK